MNVMSRRRRSPDARAWVEFLRQDVATPPNLRDCQWQLVPRRQYTESRALKKRAREGKWDQGRNLPWPDIPEDGDDLEELAWKFMHKHGLCASRPKVTDRKQKGTTADAKDETQMLMVKDVLSQLMAMKEEADGNAAEEERQHGTTIRYGDAVQLLHVSTQTFLSVAKQQAIEKGSKKAELVGKDEGSELCVFNVRPAFKTYMSGDIVSSGDLVVLELRKPIGGMYYYIRMSELAAQDKDGSQLKNLKGTLRALQVDNPAVEDVEEINAATANSKTFWRMLRFKGCDDVESWPANNYFKAEDVVAFYHKEAEAYLHLDIADWKKGRAPCFRLSTRISQKLRKKSSWMFKVESVQPLNGGDKIRSGDANQYRIKHVISNTYLKRNGAELEATADYSDPACLFWFKQFERDSETDVLHVNKLVFLRCAQGSWLTQRDEQAYDNDAERLEDKGIADDRSRERKATFTETDMVPEREALWVMPIRQSSVVSVVQIRRCMLTLSEFRDLLTELDDLGDTSQPGDKAPPLEAMSDGARKVLEITNACHANVGATLRKLVINCTVDVDPNPLSREGTPNRLMQKLLREHDAIHMLMSLIALPFAKGIGLAWFAHKNRNLANLLELITLMYRLVKQVSPTLCLTPATRSPKPEARTD